VPRANSGRSGDLLTPAQSGNLRLDLHGPDVDTSGVSERFIVGETVVVRLSNGTRPRVRLCEIVDTPSAERSEWTVRLEDGSTAAVASASLLERAVLVRYPCPCCGYLTIVSFDHGPPGTYAICPVCRWEDDYMTDAGGANPRPIEAVRADFRMWRDAGMPSDPKRRPPSADEVPVRR
jgi:hypothetical protein